MNGHCNHLAIKLSVCVKDAKTDFRRCIGYLSFTKDRIKHDLLQRFLTTTELSKFLTSCLTAVKYHGIRYCEKVYERSGKNVFGQLKILVRYLIN